MADTPRSQSYLTGTAYRDGQTAGSITPQTMRDLIVTIVPTVQTATSGSSVAMTATMLLINKASGSATAVTLPAAPVTVTQTYTIKDQRGDASTNNITITDPNGALIDGQSSVIINVSRQSLSLVWDGSTWSLV